MSNNALRVPSAEDISQAKETSRTLSKYHNADRVNLSIKSGDNESDEFVLPGYMMEMLLDILSEVSKGNAISIIPFKAELSTQQAANILNVSRPYLVKLLEEGKIDFHKVGSHRRVYCKDVLEYKASVDSDRSNTLDELTKFSQELGMGY